MGRRGDHEHLVVAQVRRHQVGRQVRGLDEPSRTFTSLTSSMTLVEFGDGELHDRRCLLGAGLLDVAQLDQPVRHEVLGDGLARGDRQPVRHAGPHRPQPCLEPVGGVKHVLGPAHDEAPLLGEVGSAR